MGIGIYDALKMVLDHIVAITKKENVEFLKGSTYPARLAKNVKLDVLRKKLVPIFPEGVTFTGERAKPWGLQPHAVWTARMSLMRPFAIKSMPMIITGKKLPLKVAPALLRN